MRKRVVSIALIILGSLLVAAALALLFYNLWDDARAEKSVQTVLETLKQEQPPAKDVDVSGDMTPDSPSIPLPDYVLNPEMDMPAVEIDGYRYIGTLSIPALELELPVMETWSYPQMKISPCRYTGSAYLDDLVIAAHNYASHFGRLKNLQVGDEIQFTDMAGNRFRYTVLQTETVSGQDVSELLGGEWDLTLFTCTLDGRMRVAVRCARAEG